MAFLKEVQDHLAAINLEIAKAELETRQHIERWEGRDIDQDKLRREEWDRFNWQTYVLRRERDTIADLLARHYGLHAPPPFILKDQQTI